MPSKSALLLHLAALLCVSAAGVPQVCAQAFSFPSPVATGAASSPAQVTVTVRTSGTISAVSVVGQGNPGVDFTQVSAGTCSPGLSFTAGQTCTIGVSFAPVSPGARRGAVVLTANNGTVLGTEFLSGTGVGALGVFVPGMIQTFAGHATWIYNGDGELAVNASIFLPFGIALDSAGNVYIADQGNERIRKVAASTGVISTIAGNGIVGGTGDGGPALQAAFSNPASIALDGAGNLFISDTGNNAVRKISAATGVITTVAGMIGHVGYTGDGGPATSATLNGPNGIDLDAAGDLFIADTANNVIRRVDAVSGIITTVAGNGAASYNGDGGPAVAASLNAPWSVTLTPSGNFYIADQGNNRIRIVYSVGTITTVAGTGSGSFSGDLGPALSAALDAPSSVVLDPAGNMYIADSGNNRVRKVAFGTNTISTIAGLASQSISGDGGPANNAGLYGPYTLALDGLGNLYIADVFHNRIRQVLANTASLDFQPMRIGRVAPPQPQTLENDGNAAMNLASIQAVSNSVLDAPTTTCSSGQALAVLSTCVIGASFAPTMLGTPALGSISVNSDAANAPGQIVLSGNVLNQDPSTVTIAASANPITVGNVVYFTVTVTSDGTVPTGQVTLYDGSTAIGTAALQAGGVATFSTSTLTGGQHTISATYAGDSNNTPGTSSSLLETVTDIVAPTKTALTASASNVLAGMPLTLSATVTLVNPGSGSGTLAGSVTFSDGSTVLGAGSVSATGIATLTLKTLSVAQHSIVASYSATSSFGASTSSAISVLVQAGTTTTSLASPVNPSFGGAAVALNVAVTSNGATPTGTVSFADGATPLGTATLSAAGTASFSARGLGLGPHNIVATYGGDADNNGSSSPALSQTVVIASTASAVTSSLNPAPQGSPVGLTANVTGNGGIPTGLVQFFDGNAPLGSATLNATGTATLTTSSLALGVHAITAGYQGDALDGVSTSAVLTQRIVQATSTSLASSSPNGIAGASITWTANVTGHSNLPVTGTIAFNDGATTLATVPLNSSGTATYVSAASSIGSHSLTAVYSGDPENQASTSPVLVQNIQIATTATSLISSANPAFAGANLTLTASVTGNGGAPSGTVVLHDGTATIGPVPVSSTGAAVFSLTTLTPGTHTLIAAYSGDANDSPSNSVALTLSVVQQTALTTTSSANPSMIQDSVAITVSVSGGLAAYPPTGTVTLNDGTSSIGTAAVDALGNAHFTLAAPALGQHILTASYAGDTHNSPATAPAFTQSVILRPTTNTFSASSLSLSAGQQVTFIALIQGAGPSFPTGTVTFVSGSTVLGSAPLNAKGLATLTFPPPQGSYNIVAEYPGDPLFAASNSTTTAVIVGPTQEFTMTVTPPTVFMTSGSHATLNIAIASAATFNDTLAIGCAGLPAFATCTFSANNIKVSGGSSSTLTLVLDTGDPLGAGASASLASHRAPGVLACILPGGAVLALLLLPLRRFRKQLSALAVLLLMAGVATLSGCANSLTMSDTPAGTYTIQVVGTGATSGATQAGTITLTVNAK